MISEADPETGKPVSLPFLGPYTTVNGRIWPHLDVDDAWYRFRLVNASNARIYDLVLVDEENNPVPGVIRQIGSDGGLLPRPVPVDFDEVLPQLTIAPAERMDLLIDFSALVEAAGSGWSTGAGSRRGCRTLPRTCRSRR